MSVDPSPRVMGQTRIGTICDPSPANFDLKSFLKYYLLSCKVDGKSQATIDTYQIRLGLFVQFAEANGFPQAGQLTSNNIRMFLLSLNDRHLQPATVHAYHRALRTWFTWLVNEGLLEKTPMQNIKPPRLPKKIPHPFSTQDLENLLLLTSGNHFVDIRNRAIILTFLDTGLRLNELLSIKLIDISTEYDTIRVFGKGSKERVVSLGKVARKALLKYLMLRNDTYANLWVTEERRPLQRDGLRIIIRRLCERAEITDAKHGAHTFRHTFATNSIRNGANIFFVQSLLGHSTLEMTRRYAGMINSETAVQKHNEFSPVDRFLK